MHTYLLTTVPNRNTHMKPTYFAFGATYAPLFLLHDLQDLVQFPETRIDTRKNSILSPCFHIGVSRPAKKL